MISDIFTIRRYGPGENDWQMIPLDVLRTVDAALAMSPKLGAVGAEPGVKSGELGVRLTGKAGPAPSQASLDDLRETAERLRANGADEDAAAIDSILARYSGSSQGMTSAMGISTGDAALDKSIMEGRRQRDYTKSVARGYRDFWASDAETKRKAALDIMLMK